ncbi:peptidase M18 [Apodospora peruviana]|uniref:aspartyl aminopeptidase n=1 Tax=Apodospora peruviana TaxID=516989 RepID=A0AAE0HVB5_9PEZI|nr:peptidase M18 [Apodospora peruviana]
MAPPKSAYEFLDFVNASPTPYHAVASAVKLLEAAGFTAIRERENWSATVKPGGKYYLTRNGSSIVAFTVGAKWRPGNPVGIVGAHTDSPCLRIKPVSKKSANGYLQVGVEVYGGGIWHSWFDRDLGVAGRVFAREADGTFVQKLVKIDRPILRIPRLAIHLDRDTNFNPNKEDELLPILGLVASQLNAPTETPPAPGSEAGSSSEENYQPLKELSERHGSYLLDTIAEHAGVETSQIKDFELVLYDTQKSCLGGLHEEFIYSARLDNLDMTYCSIQGIIESVKSTSLDNDTSIRMIACFDHEEIGSTSAQGADSNMLPAVLRRLSVLPIGDSQTSNSDEAFEQTLSKSFLVSADMAHAVHPNYARKYEANHQPQMNKGTVIKVNANQRYATNSPGIVLVQEAARLAGVPLQLFVVKNDSPCGSTIGPMLSAKMGMRTLDLGNPQLSMHSIRETGGSWDVEYAIKLFDSFLGSYGTLEDKILVD